MKFSGWRLHTGTTECTLETLIRETERFGWTTFPVVVRKQTLRCVHTTAGAVMTVFTMRMSLWDARSQVWSVICYCLLLITVCVSGKMKSETSHSMHNHWCFWTTTTKNLNTVLSFLSRLSMQCTRAMLFIEICPSAWMSVCPTYPMLLMYLIEWT